MIASPTLYINVTNYLNVTYRGHVHLNIIWNCVSVYSWVTCWTREFRSAVSMFKKNTVYEIILTLKNRWGLGKSCMLLPWQQEENKHWGSYLNICFTLYAKSTSLAEKELCTFVSDYLFYLLSNILVWKRCTRFICISSLLFKLLNGMKNKMIPFIVHLAKWWHIITFF